MTVESTIAAVPLQQKSINVSQKSINASCTFLSCFVPRCDKYHPRLWCKNNHINSFKRFHIFYKKIYFFILFFILHHHFYKTPTSVYLLYTIFYINNIFIFFFLIYFFSFSLSLYHFLFLFLPFLSSSFSHG